MMFPLRVSDLKQYIYCPRIIYYYYVLPIPRRVTRKMEYGKLEHVEITRLEKRRRLKAYGLLEGERKFQVHLESSRLGLHGLLDMMITTAGGQVYPVEFKYSPSKKGLHVIEFKYSPSKKGLHVKYQLAAYAMLLEESLRKPVRYGFLYLIPSKSVMPMEITSSMRDYVKKALTAIRNIISGERVPVYTRSKSRCVNCEFKNYCTDSGW